jgi:hypothetical protein
MDMSQIQARITELEARRARGDSVPELDALYKRMDAMTDQGYRTATGEDKKTFAPSGTQTLPGKPENKSKPQNLPGKGKTEKLGEGMTKYRAGGKVSSASARADGCAQRGKTRGKMV